MDNSMWLIAGPILAGIVAGWGYIKGTLGKIRSLFVMNVTVESGIADAIAFYCWHNLKRIRIGDRKYSGRRAFIRSKSRYQHIAYEIFSQSSIIFWDKFRPLLINIEKTNTDSGDMQSSGNGGGLTFTFIRGTWNIDKLIADATDLYNEHQYKGFQKKRFYVVRKYGSLGASPNDQGCDVEVAEDRICLWDKRLINMDADNIGQPIHTNNKPFESLAIPPEIWDSIKDMERWKASEEWYKEKRIPWKRGWLLYGSPGTGKTSIVRAIGEHLDMPVISFALSSFTDREFQEDWDQLRSRVPCIALIEDIDTVFKGRENITKGGQMQKPLSFDTVLNTIDGISNSDGIFTVITTNNIDYLDPALGKPEKGREISTRPGRIDKAIKLDILDSVCRTLIADRILCDCPDLKEELIIKGDGDTGAQFQDRCSKIALAHYFENKEESGQRFKKLKEINMEACLKVKEEVKNLDHLLTQ